jgi:hypothetical protein
LLDISQRYVSTLLTRQVKFSPPDRQTVECVFFEKDAVVWFEGGLQGKGPTFFNVHVSFFAPKCAHTLISS